MLLTISYIFPYTTLMAIEQINNLDEAYNLVKELEGHIFGNWDELDVRPRPTHSTILVFSSGALCVGLFVCKKGCFTFHRILRI